MLGGRVGLCWVGGRDYAVWEGGSMTCFFFDVWVDFKKSCLCHFLFKYIFLYYLIIDYEVVNLV